MTRRGHVIRERGPTHGLAGKPAKLILRQFAGLGVHGLQDRRTVALSYILLRCKTADGTVCEPSP
jgi:hypothetical protein